MRGWMVTVSVVKDDDEIGHEMYAVAIGDPAQAVKSAVVIDYVTESSRRWSHIVKLTQERKCILSNIDCITLK